MQSPDINADIPTPLTSQLLILTKDWLSIATFGLVFSDIERKSSLLHNLYRGNCQIFIES